MEICAISQGHPLWQETISFADDSAWRAGPYLARQMEKNAFLPWERVIVACQDGSIMGYCTLTEKDELPRKYPFSPLIGFVYVKEPYRGRRVSQRMIDFAAAYAKGLGYENIYLMSEEKGLYEKYGFEKIGDYETIFGTVDQLFQRKL